MIPAPEKIATPTETRPVGVLVSVGLVVGAPLLFHLIAYAQHVNAYHGICGPHAPDIKAHPCDYATYCAEFSAGFSGMGLLFIEIMLAVAVLVLVCCAWLAWAVARHFSSGRAR